MGLVLCRKKGEVISLDNEVYVEISNFNSFNNSVEIYIYNKLTNKESVYDLSLEGYLIFKWGKCKKIYLSVKKQGKNQFKIYIEADKSISISRKNRIDYNFDNDLINLDYSTGDFKNNNNLEKDDLVEKYKEELSWFYQ